MNADGPSAGNRSGSPVSHAASEISRIAAPPSMAATTDTTFVSSISESIAGRLRRARSISQRVRSETPRTPAINCTFPA